MKNRKLKAVVTVYLSMLIVVMLSFFMAIKESSTIAIAKSYARGEAERSIESIFAEYHTILLQEFGIFAIEGSYETGTYEVANIINRLAFYGSQEMEWDAVSMQRLSDYNGAAFEVQMLTYVQQKYGMTTLNSVEVEVDT